MAKSQRQMDEEGGIPPGSEDGARVREIADRAPDTVIVIGAYEQARRGFPTDADLADACGVAGEEVARWKRGLAGDPSTTQLLFDLALVVSRLLAYYRPSVVPHWLYGHSPDLAGMQPVELLRKGDLADVLAAMDAQTSGSYI